MTTRLPSSLLKVAVPLTYGGTDLLYILPFTDIR